MTDTTTTTTPLVTETNVGHLVALAFVVTALVVIYLGLTLISGEISQLHHIAGPSTTPSGPLH